MVKNDEQYKKKKNWKSSISSWKQAIKKEWFIMTTNNMSCETINSYFVGCCYY